jgi:hypothetical protein
MVRSRAWLVLLVGAGCAWGDGPPALDDPSVTDTASSEAVAAPGERVGSAPRPLPEGAVADPDCDLTGRWWSVESTVQVGFGGAVRQETRLLEYWELSQVGTDLTVVRHRVCDIASRSVGALAATQVFYAEAYRDALRAQVRYDGRVGLVGGLGQARCVLSMGEAAHVRGATLPHFADPAFPLPSEPAAQGAPGTEDWDDDGAPGLSVQITGAATGRVFSVTRSFDAPYGEFPAGAARFAVAESFRTERVALGSAPPGLPSAELSASVDPADHGRTFLRLAADELTLRDDAALCEALRARVGAELQLPDGEVP